MSYAPLSSGTHMHLLRHMLFVANVSALLPYSANTKTKYHRNLATGASPTQHIQERKLTPNPTSQHFIYLKRFVRFVDLTEGSRQLNWTTNACRDLHHNGQDRKELLGCSILNAIVNLLPKRQRSWSSLIAIKPRCSFGEMEQDETKLKRWKYNTNKVPESHGTPQQKDESATTVQKWGGGSVCDTTRS